MRLYRCNNCGREFEAERAECVACKIDVSANSRFKGIVTPLVTIHFDPPTHVAGVGKNHLACDPKQSVQGKHATGVPSVVNCQPCRATKEWQEAYQGEPHMIEDEEQ